MDRIGHKDKAERGSEFVMMVDQEWFTMLRYSTIDGLQRLNGLIASSGVDKQQRDLWTERRDRLRDFQSKLLEAGKAFGMEVE